MSLMILQINQKFQKVRRISYWQKVKFLQVFHISRFKISLLYITLTSSSRNFASRQPKKCILNSSLSLETCALEYQNFASNDLEWLEFILLLTCGCFTIRGYLDLALLMQLNDHFVSSYDPIQICAVINMIEVLKYFYSC